MKTTKEIIQEAIKATTFMDDIGHGSDADKILALAERAAALYARLESVKKLVCPVSDPSLPLNDEIC